MYLLPIRATFFLCWCEVPCCVPPPAARGYRAHTPREGQSEEGKTDPLPLPSSRASRKAVQEEVLFQFIASCLSACAILEIPCWSGTEGCLHHSLWFICDCCRFVFWAYEYHEAGIQQRIIAHNGIVKSTQTTITLLGIWLFYGISDLPASTMYVHGHTARLLRVFHSFLILL